MKLKKQTVWLLTMLSLVVVLSVYYVQSPSMGKNPLTFNFDGGAGKDVQTTSEGTKPTSKTDGEKSDTTKNTAIEKSDYFAELRLQLEDQRSAAKEEYESIVASASASSDDKNRAFTEISKLNDVQAKESLIEMMIVEMGYKDVLVRADDVRVMVNVMSEKLSPKQANEIIHLVKTEMGNRVVSVKFEPSKK